MTGISDLWHRFEARFSQENSRPPSEIEKQLELIRVAALVTSVVCAVFSVTALLALHPWSALSELGFAYIAYEGYQFTTDLLPHARNNEALGLQTDVRDLSYLTKNTPLLRLVMTLFKN
jgi:hypothetical protein